jgi:hypothetical protein
MHLNEPTDELGLMVKGGQPGRARQSDAQRPNQIGLTVTATELSRPDDIAVAQ